MTSSATVAAATAAQARIPKLASDGTRETVTAAKPIVSTTPPRMIALPVSATPRRIADSIESPGRRCRSSAVRTWTVSSTARPRQTLKTITVAGSRCLPVATITAPITARGKTLGMRLTRPASGERKASARIVPITTTSRARLEPRSRTNCRTFRAERTDIPASWNRHPGWEASRPTSPASIRS